MSPARKRATPAATTATAPPRRIVVAITGATGTVYGLRLLAALRSASIETHLVVSEAGVLNAWHEHGMSRGDFDCLADVVHNPRDIGASIASGSFLTEGMVVAPCSMRTLGCIAHALSDNLVARAADVVLKERRRLVLLTREAPLNLAHLRNMTAVTEMGGVIFPPVPAFYSSAATIDDLVDHTTGRILDLFGIHTGAIARWQGLKVGRETDSKDRKR